MFKVTMTPGYVGGKWLSVYEYVDSHDIIEKIKGTSLSQDIEHIEMEDDADVGMHAFGYRTDNFDDFYNWYDWEVGDLRIRWDNGCVLHVDPSKRKIFFHSPDKSVDLNDFFSNAKQL